MFPTLCLDKRVLLVSDIHLGPSIPNTCQAFYRFLEQAPSMADHLILLGDIFTAWIGDDWAFKHISPWLEEAIFHLKQASQQIPLYFVHGNRDFLVGQRFTHFINTTLLPDQFILQTDHFHLFISHGDELCTQDKGFMLFRRWTHKPWVQRLFLTLPLKTRIQLAKKARHQSESHHGHQHYGDVDKKTARDVFTRALDQDPQLMGMIHGHTHLPACHSFQLNDHPFSRWVLPDWELDHGTKRSGYLLIDKAITLVTQ